MAYDKRRFIQVTIPVTPDEHDRIKQLAEADDRSIAKTVRAIVIKSITHIRVTRIPAR